MPHHAKDQPLAGRETEKGVTASLSELESRDGSARRQLERRDDNSCEYGEAEDGAIPPKSRVARDRGEASSDDHGHYKD